MRGMVLLLVLLLGHVGVVAGEARPLLGGFHPDPSVCKGGDGAYYVVNSSFMWNPGLPVYRSTDFRNWSLVGHALSDFRAFKLAGNELDNDGVWAPTLRYHNGTYYLVFTFSCRGRKHNCLTTARHPAGPWSEPRVIREDSNGGIDPSLFFDDDGHVYWQANRMIPDSLKQWKSQTMCYAQEIDLTSARLIGERHDLSSGVCPKAAHCEGPHLYKMSDGTYLLLHAEGGTGVNHAETARKASAVFGPYEVQRTNPVLTRRERKGGLGLACAGHMDLVPIASNEFFAVFLGQRVIGDAAHAARRLLGRETFACRAFWRDGELVAESSDDDLIAGKIVTPEPMCQVVVPGLDLHVRRVLDICFDEKVSVAPDESAVLYRGSRSYLAWPNETGKTAEMRLVSTDGLSVQAYLNGEKLGAPRDTKPLCENLQHCSFTGLGVGTMKNVVSPQFINGPVVRKVVVNEAPIAKGATWSVSGLGVFTCYINGHEVGAEDALKPGYTDVRKRRHVYTYDVTDYLNRGVGETNVFSAIVTDGWWSDNIMGKHRGQHNAFWCDGVVKSGADWESTTNTPVRAGIWEGERFDAAKSCQSCATASPSPNAWSRATINTEFKGEMTPVTGAKMCYREPLKEVARWRVGNKTIVDFGQNCAAVPRFTLRGKPGATFRYRLGEILNDGIKGHRGDGEANTVYLANLRGAAVDLSYTFNSQPPTPNTQPPTTTYQPKYTFYGYRYLQFEDNPDVELLSVESIPVTSISPNLERGTLEVGDPSLNRLVQNVYWGMLSNYLSIPTDCPQRSERCGWAADTQVFSETAGYFADTRGFLGKWMQDLRDAQHDDGLFPDVAPLGAFGDDGGQAAWADAGIVVPYRVWKQFGDAQIVRENWDAMMKFMRFVDRTGYEMKRGQWLICDWLSYEHLKVDQRNHWQNGTYTADHLSYQNFVNACYAVSDCQMLREMMENGKWNREQGIGEDDKFIDELESKFREKIRQTWLNADGSLAHLFDNMQTPRLMALKIGMGDTARHAKELIEIIHKNGDRLSTGFVGTSELLTQLARIGEYDLAWTLVLQHEFPSWLYSVDQGATTVWERWDGYTKERGFGDVGMNSYNHYAYGSVVGWLFADGAGIKPGQDGGYRHFILAPHPDKRARSLKATYQTPYGTIVSAWRYEGDQLYWHYEIPEGVEAEILPPPGALRN